MKIGIYELWLDSSFNPVFYYIEIEILFNAFMNFEYGLIRGYVIKFSTSLSSYDPIIHVFIILNPASENARTVKAYIILISSDPCQWVSKTTWNIVDGTSIHGGLNSKIVQYLRKSYFLIQKLKSSWFWNIFRRSIEKISMNFSFWGLWACTYHIW